MSKIERHLEKSKLYYLFIVVIVFFVVFQFIQPLFQNFGSADQQTPYSPSKEIENVYNPFGVCHGYAESGEKYQELVNQGVKISRNDIYWQSFEPTKGNFNYKPFDYRYGNFTKYGIESLAILDYGNTNILGEEYGRHIPKDKIDHWLDYVNEAILRYKENVTYFEIWNEPNIDKFWNGTETEFFYLLNRTAYYIRDISPDVKIIAPGISGHDPDYLDRMISYIGSEQFEELFYALNFHPYSGSNAEIIAQKIQEVKAVAEKHEFNGEIWITEVGMSTDVSSEDRIEEEYREKWERQAEQLIKTYAEALTAGIDRVIWYCYRDSKNIDWTYGEAAFGIQHYSQKYNQWIYKPAGYAFQYLSRKLPNSRNFGQSLVVETPQWVDKDLIHTYSFYTDKNTIMLILWSETVVDKATMKFSSALEEIVDPNTNMTLETFDFVRNETNIQTMGILESIEVELSNQPIMLEFNYTQAVNQQDLNTNSPLLMNIKVGYTQKTGVIIRIIPWIFIIGIAMVAKKINIKLD